MKNKYNIIPDFQKEYERHAWKQLTAHENCTKEDLKEELDKKGIAYKKNCCWDEYYSAAEKAYGMEYLVEKYCGVSSQQYQERFKITHKDVKRLERLGILKITNYYKIKLYGTHYAPLYSLNQFYSITQEDMDALLRKYPKGFRKSNL